MSTLETPAIASADSYYRDVYEHAPDGMYSIDSDGVIIACNETWASMLGYAKAEIIGRRSVDLLTAASMAKAVALLPIFFRDGEIYDVDFQFVRSDGSVLDAKLSATLHDDPDTGERFSRAIIRAVPESEGQEPVGGAALDVSPGVGRDQGPDGSAERRRSTVILAIEAPALREVCRQRLRSEGHVAIALDRPLALLTLPRTLNYDLVCVDGRLRRRRPRPAGRARPVARAGPRPRPRARRRDCQPASAAGPRALPPRHRRDREKARRDRSQHARIEIDSGRRLVRANGREVDLTPTQCRLLELLYERRPREASTEEILETVWGFTDALGGGDLVRSHVRNLRAKLAAIGLADSVVSRRGRGYALVADPT